jgi:iron complex transport system substrate-binding protein
MSIPGPNSPKGRAQGKRREVNIVMGKRISSRFIFGLVVLATLQLTVMFQTTPHLLAQNVPKGSRIVTDQVGRKVVLQEEVNRIVVTFPFQIPVIYALGARENLVGVDTRTPRYESYNRLDPTLQKLPTVGILGGSFNSEELLRLRPDVVLCGPQDVPHMEKLNLSAVATSPWKGKPEESIMIVGKAIKKEKRAEELIGDFKRIVDMAKSKTADIPKSSKKKVYAVVGNPLTTYGGDQYFSQMVAAAGGVNTAEALKGSQAKVSKEQLLEWNPDIMVVIAWGSEMSGVKDILADPALKETNAARNRWIFSDPGYYSRWVHPDITSCLGVLWMATIMYPERFPDVDMNKIADEFDRKYFDKPFGGTIPH